MKSKEEIEQLAKDYAETFRLKTQKIGWYFEKIEDYTKGYKQCQEDNKDKKYTEEDLLHAFREGVLLPNSQIGIMEDIFKQVVQSLNKQD